MDRPGDGRQHEKRERERKRKKKERKERSGRMLQYIGGCMRSDVEKREQESDPRLHEGKERKRESKREPSMYPVFEPKVLRAS